MAIVKFNDPAEFCDELNKEVEAGRIPDRSIVRLTTMSSLSSISPNIRHVSVVATYSTWGQVTRLERYCGDLWGLGQPSDEQVTQKVKEIHEHIERACKALQLEVRAGMVEDDPEKR